MVKRPIVIACIGYILGIIYGLYFRLSIALLLGIIGVFIFALMKIKRHYTTIDKSVSGFNDTLLFTPKKCIKRIRPYKIFFPKKAIIIFCIFFIVANVYINLLSMKYEKIYNINGEVLVRGIITKAEEKEYSNKYIVSVKSINNKKHKGINFLLYLKKNESKLKVGDYIEVLSEYEKPTDSRNYGGFSYRNYLKQSNIYGIITTKYKVNVIKNNQCNFIYSLANMTREAIQKKTSENLSKQASDVFLGIIIGEKSQISNEINTYFKDSNMAHILAVSGAHVSYIILTVTMLLNKMGKRINGIITIIVLIFFMILADFSPSVVRACIMAIIALTAKLMYRKSDIYNNLAISCIIILLINPYDVLNVGFQLSFLGTLGIVLLHEKIEKHVGAHGCTIQKHKLKQSILNMIIISICVQLLIMPIMIINFNTFSLNFLISGVIATPIFAGIMVVGILSLITGKIGLYLFPLIEILVNLLIFISKFVSNIPYSKLILKTPNIICIIAYYIVLSTILFSKGKNALRIMKDKRRINKLLKNIVTVVLCICITIQIVQDNTFRDLKIHFIDVGQGDSCLIVTPNNKTVLIDGGGSSNKDYDIGKNVLVPYLLDRRINSIDYILVSHFDNDHCGGLMYVLETLKVKNILVSKQCKITTEYEAFMQIAKKKKITVTTVKQGDVICIEKDIKIQILYPTSNLKFDDLNNNSIVAKFIYKDFSMLFTGDIEEKAEQEILEMYNNKTLKSTVLKVGHHGSKTSSTETFLSAVKPKIALIGVGENNNFGHPSEQVVDRLESIGTKVYRTDKMGEITIKISRNNAMSISKQLE